MSDARWSGCIPTESASPTLQRAVPAAPPRMPKGEGPIIPADGIIRGTPEPLPDVMDFDAAKQRVSIGNGFVDKVTKAIVDYQVSGRNILRQGFSYRKLDRSRPMIGDDGRRTAR